MFNAVKNKHPSYIRSYCCCRLLFTCSLVEVSYFSIGAETLISLGCEALYK